MSGTTSPVRSAPSDIMALQVGSATIAPWESVSVTVSVETIPNHFTFTAGEKFPGSSASLDVSPGTPCKILIGDQVVLTGFVDSVNMQIGPSQHEIIVAGRGLCQDLVDCSVDLASNPAVTGGMINAANTFDLAQKLAKQFDQIKVRAAVSDLGKPIQKMQVALGETAYEILERVARWAGYLIYEDSAGMLVIDRVGTKRMASGFSMPGIIEAAQITAEIAGRYSDYLVVWNAISQLTELSNTANQRGSAHDPTMPRKRLRVIVSPQLDPTAGASDIDFGQQLANWEMARRIGRSQAMAVTCDTWRDTAGRLWTPNFLAPINVPQGKLANKEWIIGTVTYRKDASGTHADVILMPPDAFRPQPGVLYLFDRESTADPPTSQDPAPPGTPGAQGHA